MKPVITDLKKNVDHSDKENTKTSSHHKNHQNEQIAMDRQTLRNDLNTIVRQLLDLSPKDKRRRGWTILTCGRTLGKELKTISLSCNKATSRAQDWPR